MATYSSLQPQLAQPQDTSKNDPRKRLRRFFETLYACLAKGARAVLQVRFWPGCRLGSCPGGFSLWHMT